MMQKESIQISVEGTIKGFEGMYSEIKRITDGLRGWQKQVVGATDMAKNLNAPVEDLKRSMQAQGYLTKQSALETGNAFSFFLPFNHSIIKYLRVSLN